MNNKSHEDVKEELIEGLKRPIPENIEDISNRFLWLGIACLKNSKFGIKYLNEYFKIDNIKQDDIRYETFMLLLYKGFDVSIDILLKNLKKYSPTEKGEIARSCLDEIIHLVSTIFNKEEHEMLELFQEYQNVSSGNIEKRDEDTINLYAKRLNINLIDNQQLLFIKDRILMSSFFTALDAFASVKQSEIDEDLEYFIKILNTEN